MSNTYIYIYGERDIPVNFKNITYVLNLLHGDPFRVTYSHFKKFYYNKSTN